MTDTTINIVITIPQLDGFLLALAARVGGDGTPTPAPRGEQSGEGDAAAPAATRRRNTKASATDASQGSAGTTETKNSDATTGAGSTDTGPTALDYETQVKPKIIELGKVKGRDAAKAMLTEFEVTSGTELDTAVYPAVLKRIDELMQPEAEADIA